MSYSVMIASTTTSDAKSIQQQVLRIISKRKAIKARRLRISSSLSRELGFDTVDVVDIILELERNFHITIPDEVPLATVGDFVSYVASHTKAA
ncbi:acyl carrier protein [Hymenobacter psychrotolerans]|uniref:Acyl carrier protein n=1 Tax=Hymenobacter psychrotolerans DSM 18569 TaxID=1121959 RepID=A0A1M6P6G1_9BACT|nr:acyl carrier protein [Hymenobacter psychrotolerans]SHK03482.1 acyl carrier protein [Hymenobacter psychrotolerans DSM 18569]